MLAALGAAQVVLLQGTVEWHLQLRGPMALELLALFGASVAGTGLGLLISALATTQERAVVRGAASAAPTNIVLPAGHPE